MISWLVPITPGPRTAHGNASAPATASVRTCPPFARLPVPGLPALARPRRTVAVTVARTLVPAVSRVIAADWGVEPRRPRRTYSLRAVGTLVSRVARAHPELVARAVAVAVPVALASGPGPVCYSEDEQEQVR